jgi:hypothetical protein
MVGVHGHPADERRGFLVSVGFGQRGEAGDGDEVIGE